jgi:energy-coupling factor transport system substrate-specific component
MSWQLAAFAILAVALAAGFAWYERSRPDARIVALVGTLAAFAALGRIAFAPLPNVKPTTDIVLISGYALGGAPGFVVGALAGLVSNFFFGQGPWTPWQMAAWGATGVIGAGLAVVTRGRIGRWPLALACMVVGFGFAAVQDVGDWVTYSDHSAAALGIYVGKGIGFDLIHAGGCVVFALLFGPALTRSIQRFARRLQVRWQSAAAVGTIGAVVLIGVVLDIQNTAFGVGQASAASDPTAYLLGAQNRDGGLGAAPGQLSDPTFAGWAALGLASAGHNPLDVSHGGTSLLDYVRAAPRSDVGALERTILALRAAGLSGQNLVGALRAKFRSDGSVSDQVNLTAFAILALRAAGAPAPSRTVVWLRRQQNADGGFSFATAGGASDVDDTGAALEALGADARAVAFIRTQQNGDGGFPSQPGESSNAQSTAWAVQGLLAAGVDPGSLHRRGARAPLAYLQSLVAPDGHVRYARGTDQTPVWVTAQALMALERKPLPLAPVPRAPSAATTQSRSPRARHVTAAGATATAAAARATAATGAAATAATPPAAISTTHLKKVNEAGKKRAIATAARGSPAMLRYAADLGFLTAVVLAPVGAG